MPVDPASLRGRVLSKEDREYLFSVYSAERQDDQNALVTAFAIATAGITYVALGVAYINDHCNSKGCTVSGGLSNLVLLTAPVIPLALAAFLALNLAASRIRSVHLQRLEYALQVPLYNVHDSPTAPSFHTDAGLVYRPLDRLGDRPYGARALFAAVTVMAYVPILATLLGFTWIAVLHIPAGTMRAAAIWGYGLAEGIEVMALLRSLGGSRFTYTGPAARALPTQSSPKLVLALDAQGCTPAPSNNDHQLWSCPCGKHNTVLPPAKEVTEEVARSIVGDLACLGGGWLR